MYSSLLSVLWKNFCRCFCSVLCAVHFVNVLFCGAQRVFHMLCLCMCCQINEDIFLIFLCFVYLYVFSYIAANLPLLATTVMSHEICHLACTQVPLKNWAKMG